MQFRKMLKFLPHVLFFILGLAVAVSCFFLPPLPNAIGRFVPDIPDQIILASLRHGFLAVLALGVIHEIAYGPLAALAIAFGARLYFGRRVRLISFVAGLAIPFTLFLAVMRYGPSIQEYWHRQPFDASAWRSAHEDCSSYWTTRITMMHSLIELKQLPGKTKAEILALLGPADDFAQIPLEGRRNFDKADWDLG